MAATAPVIVPLSPDLMARLSARAIPPALAARDWPLLDPYLAADPEVASLAERILQVLDGPAGWAVLRAEHDEPPAGLFNAFWNLFTCLGRPLHQILSGDLWVPLKRNGDAAVEFHNDGGYVHDYTPPYVVSVCIRQAAEGGESLLVDGRPVYDELCARHPEVLETLRSRIYQVDCCGHSAGMDVKPCTILNIDNRAGLRFNYLRPLIERGHKLIGRQLSVRDVTTLDTLDALLDEPERQIVHRLRPGEALIFDNHRFFHARRQFRDGAEQSQQRLLVRVWLAENGLAKPA